MADIKITGAGSTQFTYTFESDHDLIDALTKFAEGANEGDAGLWLSTGDQFVWLPTGTPFMATFDGTPDPDLLDVLTNAGLDDESVEPEIH